MNRHQLSWRAVDVEKVIGEHNTGRSICALVGAEPECLSSSGRLFSTTSPHVTLHSRDGFAPTDIAASLNVIDDVT